MTTIRKQIKRAMSRRAAILIGIASNKALEQVMTDKTIILDEFHKGTSARALGDKVREMRNAISDIHANTDGIARKQSLRLSG